MKLLAVIFGSLLFATFANAANSKHALPVLNTQNNTSTPQPQVQPQQTLTQIPAATQTAPRTPQTQASFIISDAWARTSSQPQNFAALYMTIQNNSPTPCEIVALVSHVANSLQLSQSFVDEDGVSKTIKLDKILVPANSSITLKPAGFHITLYDLKSQLNNGMKIPLTLYLKDGRAFTISASVTNQNW